MTRTVESAHAMVQTILLLNIGGTVSAGRREEGTRIWGTAMCSTWVPRNREICWMMDAYGWSGSSSSSSSSNSAWGGGCAIALAGWSSSESIIMIVSLCVPLTFAGFADCLGGGAVVLSGRPPLHKMPRPVSCPYSTMVDPLGALTGYTVEAWMRCGSSYLAGACQQQAQ